MKCPAIELLTEIRDLLAANGELAHKRAVKAAQQARYRARRKAGGPTSVSAAGGADATRAEGVSPTQPQAERVPPVDTTARVDTTKEEEKGKEGKSPHTPLKEVKGKVEERKTKKARARARSVPPTPEEVADYCRERKNDIDPVLWWNYYAAKGWKLGNSKMVDWKRAVISWERNRGECGGTYGGTCGRDGARPSLDPRAAAFERQRAEAEERRRHAAEIATRLLTESGALPEGGAR